MRLTFFPASMKRWIPRSKVRHWYWPPAAPGPWSIVAQLSAVLTPSIKGLARTEPKRSYNGSLGFSWEKIALIIIACGAGGVAVGTFGLGERFSGDIGVPTLCVGGI